VRTLGRRLRCLEPLGAGVAALAVALAATGAVNAGAVIVGDRSPSLAPAAAEATRLMLLGERLVAAAGASALVPVLGEWQLQGVLTQADESLDYLRRHGDLDQEALRRLEVAWAEERAQAEVLRHADPQSATFATEGAQLWLRATAVVGAAEAVGDSARAAQAARSTARGRALLVWNVAAVVFGLALGFALHRDVVRPLNQLAELAQQTSTEIGARYGQSHPPGVAGKLTRKFDDFVGAAQRRRELEREVATDALTELANRRAFFARLEQAIARAEVSDEDFLVCYLDVNGFKGINDSFGHGVGDQALIDVAQIMRDTFRRSDVVARIGGDEFAAIAFGLSTADAAELRDRLDGKVEELNAFGDRPYRIALSTGIVGYNPLLTADALLQLADEAMYREKHGPAASDEAA
jgi:diguanylate cyclase (GGDEF)-like protein